MSTQGAQTQTDDKGSLLEQGIGFLKTCDRSWLFLALAACFVVGLAFWPLLRELPAMWLGTGAWEFRTGDGYYSHGLLVPLIAGYIVYRRWPKIKDIPVTQGWVAVVPLALMMWALWAADVTDINQIRAYAFIGALMSTVWLVAGIRWMVALSPGILYLLFALPIWTGFIDNNLNRLQILSTTVAYHMLKGIGYDVYKGSPTSLSMNHFDLNIAVPCSGLKLVVAVTAFTVLFMLIAKLKWWSNALMVVLILPLCLFINGLRIALIGIVGEEQGLTKGLAFHDYSGYVTLLVCFFILFSFAKMLGWKE